jgi:O-antigen ligase
VIPAAYALVELATGGGHAFGYGLRLKGTFTHPNIFAFYLVLIISLTLYMLKSGEKARQIEKSIALSLYMILLLALLVMTQTRSAWIACFALFVIYSLIFERRYLVYLALVPVVALFIPSVQERLLDLNAGNEYVQYANLNSFAWRRLIWETGLKWMSPSHYFFGYGLESFRPYSLVFFPMANATGYGSGAHNVYVECLFELGVIGLLAYLFLFGRLMLMLRPMFAIERLAGFISFAVILSYLIVCFSDNMLGYLSFNWYFWFFVGAATALVTTALRSNADKQQADIPPVPRSKVMQFT